MFGGPVVGTEEVSSLLQGDLWYISKRSNEPA